MPEGSSLAAAASFGMAETTSVVGILSALAAAAFAVVPLASSEPEPQAVSSRAAEVIRAKGVKCR